jgi:hypothetical protein
MTSHWVLGHGLQDVDYMLFQCRNLEQFVKVQEMSNNLEWYLEAHSEHMMVVRWQGSIKEMHNEPKHTPDA